MKSLRKRIFIELLITPATVAPIMFGGSLLLLCEVLGGYAAFLGLVGLLVGFGSFLTNMVFHMDSISKRLLKQDAEQLVRQREKELDDLDKRLSKTDGKDDENALRNLRTLYKTFSADAAGRKLSEHIPSEMLRLIDAIFTTCVAKLERSHEIYKLEATMTGSLKKDLKSQRETIINDVELLVADLAKTINEVRVLKFKSEGNELKQLQRRLSSQLEVAKATEEGMSQILNSDFSVDQRLKELG